MSNRISEEAKWNPHNIPKAQYSEATTKNLNQAQKSVIMIN